MEWWRAASGNEVEEEEEAWLPPGFRFHPTDEELVTYYLRNKVQNARFTDRAIPEVDLNKVEPWDLPGIAKIGEKQWYFFSLHDRKYPTGMRTNRATEAGYWKATGKDREIVCSRSSVLLGMKKTLVFYKGRAPRGQKTNWVIHEYRLEGSDFRDFHRLCKEEWVVCRVFKKSVPAALKSMTSLEINRQPCYEIDASLPALESPHMQYLPSSPMQEPQLLQRRHSYNQSNDSMEALHTHDIPSGSSSAYLQLPTSSFSMANIAAPFGFLEQEAAAGFNKVHHSLPFLFPSSTSNQPAVTKQQQYSNYTSIDCKMEPFYQSCINSDMMATEGSVFPHHSTNIRIPGTETTNTMPFPEAAAISHDAMTTNTCQARVVPPEFDSLWAF